MFEPIKLVLPCHFVDWYLRHDRKVTGSCICVLGLSILPLSLIFIICCSLEQFRQCMIFLFFILFLILSKGCFPDVIILFSVTFMF